MAERKTAFESVEYNLLGQRLGPKGKLARQRILTAARHLLETAPLSQPTLTAVAQEAGVTLTIIYRYYRDIGELLLDVMEPAREEMAPVVALLAKPWPPGEEYEHALALARAHFEYLSDRKGLVFVRNSLAEQGDARFVRLRMNWAMPLVWGLADKFSAAHGRKSGKRDRPIAGVIVSGMERTATVRLQGVLAAETGAPFVTPSNESLQAIAQIITALLARDCLAYGQAGKLR